MSKVRSDKRVIRKARNMWDDPHVFVSVSGNGLAVPQYELDKFENMVPKLDKVGKHVCKNLYDDIQEFAHVNDYKRILKLNGGDTSVLVTDNPIQPDIDVTKFGSAEEILNAGAKLRSHGMTLDDAICEMNKIIADLKKQKENAVVDTNPEKKVSDEVKEDDKKEK